MKPYAFHPAADKDYASAVRFYSRIRAELGVRFYEEVERLIAEVREDAERFPIFDSPIRRHFSNVFRYTVLYVDQPERILVVAVMHMKRKPGYWKRRIK